MVWNDEQVEAIIDARVPEGQAIEYKGQLPGRTDRDKAEFLKDISAMANGTGGAVLFGVGENAGSAFEFSGLKIDDADAEVRRLSQILESGIEPRLTGVRFTTVKLSKGDVLVIEVPQSFDSPHRYLFNGHSRFVIRNGTHVSELNFDQLRSAFDRSSQRLDRIRDRWEEEFSLSKLWKPIIPGPVCIVRLTPTVAADGRQVIDPKAIYESWDKLIFSDWGGGSSQFNYEGLAVFHGRGQEALRGFVQVHRTGAITAYRTARATIDDRKLIPSTTVGNFILEATKKLARFALLSGVRGSAVLHVGLTKLTGYDFAVRDGYGFDKQTLSEIDEIRMPEIWLDDLEAFPEHPDTLLRAGFDLLWQSYGSAECPQFSSEGRWSDR